MQVFGYIEPAADLPLLNPQYPLNRTLGMHHSLSGRFREDKI